jgi:hypothetical protein
MGVTEHPVESDLFLDQEWVICLTCGTLQLSNLLPLDLLYPENHSAVIGKLWKNHHKAFRDFILQDEPSDFCEIGAAHGFLASSILDKVKANYLVIEPNPLIIDPRVEVLDGFIESHLEKLSSYDAVIHSHVLEHIYEPFEFMEGIARGLKKTAALYVSFPNIEQLISTGGSNSLNFEHTYYIHPLNFEWMLHRVGLKIDRKAQYEMHSYFYKCVPDEEETYSSNLEAPNIRSKSVLFVEMWQEIEQFVAKSNAILRSTNRDTFIFGAHVFAQGLIHCGIETENIVGLLDNDPAKQGKRLYGSELMVMDPEVLQKLDSPIVILKASHYQDEIKEQILRLNGNTQILE